MLHQPRLRPGQALSFANTPLLFQIEGHAISILPGTAPCTKMHPLPGPTGPSACDRIITTPSWDGWNGMCLG